MISSEPKKHHYIPRVYLKNFLAENENIYVYKKFDDGKCFPASLDNIAHQNYYYSFEKPDGQRDNKTVEHIFSLSEGDWDGLIKKFIGRELLDINEFSNFCYFIALTRVRVPNFRKGYENFMAEMVKSTAQVLHSNPQSAKALYDEYINEYGDPSVDSAGALATAIQEIREGKINVAVNPQISLAVIEFAEKFYRFFLKLKWMIVLNETDEPFVTSDNPVFWYRLSKTGNNFIPYKGGLAAPDVEVVFPLTKNMVAIGNNFFERDFSFGAVRKKAKVRELNKYAAISADGFVYASHGNLRPLVEKYQDLVPVNKIMQVEGPNGGRYTISTASLGKRIDLPRWEV